MEAKQDLDPGSTGAENEVLAVVDFVEMEVLAVAEFT